MILVACEESGRVTTSFRNAGIEAYSCDVLPTRGNPGFHIQCDVREIIHDKKWRCIIAFPPCTHLAISGARWFSSKQREQTAAIEFFMLFANLDIPYAIENPVGIMSTRWRRPNQIIQPWQFGEYVSKATCLWLNKLPLLTPENIVAPSYSYARQLSSSNKKGRSETFRGIAEAMANQWGTVIRGL